MAEQNDENIIETAQPGSELPAGTETPLVDPNVDLSAATITPIDEAPHPPTEAELADMGRPADETDALERIEGAAVAEAFAGQKLAGFRDEDLHPNILEALRRIDVAEADWQKARESIDGQFLKSLDHLGTDFAAQAAAVRARMPA